MLLAGSSAEALPGQWSFRVGPCRGLEIGDQLWLARYMLLRCTEEFKVVASLDPKPVPGDWSGNAAYMKISTQETREVIICFKDGVNFDKALYRYIVQI